MQVIRTADDGKDFAKFGFYSLSDYCPRCPRYAISFAASVFLISEQRVYWCIRKWIDIKFMLFGLVMLTLASPRMRLLSLVGPSKGRY
jgi:hypothetical protein